MPEDISIVGYDGLPISAMTTPALTTVRQPIPRMGRIAVQRLLAHITDKDLPPSQDMLPVELVVRDSTGSNQQ